MTKDITIDVDVTNELIYIEGLKDGIELSFKHFFMMLQGELKCPPASLKRILLEEVEKQSERCKAIRADKGKCDNSKGSEGRVQAIP